MERVPIERPSREPVPSGRGDQVERLPHPVPLLDDLLRRRRSDQRLQPGLVLRHQRRGEDPRVGAGTTYGAPRNELTCTTSPGNGSRERARNAASAPHPGGYSCNPIAATASRPRPAGPGGAPPPGTPAPGRPATSSTLGPTAPAPAASPATPRSSRSALGSPTVRSRSGTVSMRKSPSSQSGTSSHASGSATRASGTGRTRVAGGDRVVLGVLVVVDEDGAGGRSSFHHFAVAIPSPRRSTSRASASAAARTVGEVPPRVDADHDVHPARARRAREADEAVLAQHLAGEQRHRAHGSHGASGIGSMSTRSSSGWSRSERRTGCGFQSTLPSETAHSRCAASTGTSSSASRPDGNFRTAVCSHSGRFAGTRFW